MRSVARSVQHEKVGLPGVGIRSQSLDPTSSLYAPGALNNPMNITSNTINGKAPTRNAPVKNALMVVREDDDAQDEYERSKQ